MSVHIKDGTPLHGPSLCDTCARAHIEKGYRTSEHLVICKAQEPVHRVTFAVSDCSDYQDKNRQTLWEMEQIAWTIAPRGPKGRAGFVPSSDAPANETEIELTLDETD